MWGEPDRLHMRYAILSIKSVLCLGSQVVNVSVTVALLSSVTAVRGS